MLVKFTYLDMQEIKLTIKSPDVIKSTLVSSVLKISLKQRPISFFEILLIAQISKKWKKKIMRQFRIICL